MREFSYPVGAAFYPEQHPESDWEPYVRRLAETGLEFVRIGEFAWSRLEPEEGKFDFTWLDRVLALLDRYGVRAMLCTPCAAPPVWAARDDLFPVREDGSVLTFGNRRHACPNSPEFRRLSARIVGALADRYGRDGRVAAWQLDNEFGHPICCCPRCLRRFGEFCRNRFGTAQAMNRALNLAFWSQELRDFDDLRYPLQLSHPAVRLAYHRFYSDSVIACYGEQADLLRARGATAPITTNFMLTWYAFDHEAMAEKLDYTAADYYPPVGRPAEVEPEIAFAAAYLRGLKHGVPGAFNEFRANAAPPGEVRARIFAAFAAGVRHVCCFRWDEDPAAQERGGFGIVRAPENPGRGAADLGRVIAELAAHRFAPAAAARTAVLFDFDSQYDFADFPGDAPERDAPCHGAYARRIARHFHGLRAVAEAGEPVDVVFPRGDFSRYRLIVVPGLRILTRETADRLTRYLDGGGRVLLFAGSAERDDNGRAFRNGPPGPLAERFGIAAAEMVPAAAGTRSGGGGTGDFAINGARLELTVSTARVLARCSDGVPALTECGGAYFLAAEPSDAAAFYRAFRDAVPW